MIGLVVVASVIGLFVYPDPNAQDLAATLQGPSWSHPFGTDELGRDVLARTLRATWVDLPVALLATYGALAVGIVLGSIAGFYRGWTERIIMRIVDVIVAFPFIVLVLAIVVIAGPGLKGALIGVALGSAAVYTRLARAEMLVLAEKPYVQAARTLGYSDRRVILRHAVPNLIRPSLVYSMSDVVINMVWLASLSYLGLGVQPPTPEWGSIIADGQAFLFSAWWISVLPGMVLVVVAVGFSFVGDGLADRFRTRPALDR